MRHQLESININQTSSKIFKFDAASMSINQTSTQTNQSHRKIDATSMNIHKHPSKIKNWSQTDPNANQITPNHIKPNQIGTNR